ncbi:MAG: ATPase domain-containing protein [Candidatus Dormibacteraceae bacterium]
MIERLPTGNDRLDQILNGGLPKNAITLVSGVPGSGKTILSQQFVFRNATKEHPALYLSTLSEPMDKILRYGETLKFFDRDALRERRVIYEDLGQVLGDDGLESTLASFERYLREIRPGIVVVDSFKVFHSFATDETSFRRFLYRLTRLLTATATTAIWNAPYTREQAIEAAEFAVADSIIGLDIKRVGEREMRVLQVLKLRGSGFRSGEHAYRITDNGFEVFPRLAEVRNQAAYELRSERASTGIEALDALLGSGGYWSGAVTLVVGPSGVGKTLMGLHFLFRGAQAGEPGILATFQENETQLNRIVKGFGWSFDESQVTVMSRSTVDLYLDEWVYQLLDRIEKTGARRVVVDSLPDLMAVAVEPVRFREWMLSLTQRLGRAGISLMMVMETPELFELRRISEQGISHLADNVVLLQYVQEGADLTRALTILKTRASHHHPVVHRFDIKPEGFVLGEALSLKR